MSKTYHSKREFQKLIKEMGGRLVINSDCHRAEMLEYGFGEAEALVKRCGFRKAGPDETADLLAPLDIYI